MNFSAVFLKYLLVCCFSTIILSCGEKAPVQPPLSPQEALGTFQLPEGYRIELVASEPLITDPVEIAFDEDGRMYVVQMDDYPSQTMEAYSAGSEPRSKIMLLDDKDGDGFYESGSVFADGLRYANGVMPWKGGVLVTSAPDILFLKDTDSDGRADEHQVLATGFALSNPQLRMSSLRYGPDGWIYGAYSRAGGGSWREEFRDRGKAIRFPARPDSQQFRIFPGANFRLRPDELIMEPSGGMSQFGLSFDEAGNQFTNWNNVHIRHVVINDHYLPNNPYLSLSTTMADISDHGNASPVYAITDKMLNLHESEIGHFTSACGVCRYTGGVFHDQYANAVFVCEPVSNIVHADILLEDGATFSAHRNVENKEFLASTDSWFRPVNLTIGPDGALYVTDFYRKLVEHPDWLAMADITGFYTHAGKLKESDFLEGNDRGRIYRIVPDAFKNNNKKRPRLSKADIKSLVSCLDHPNSWWRLNAQRLLLDRNDKNSVPLINSLLHTTLSAPGKVHALRTLEQLQSLPDSVVLSALSDENPMVRKQAVLLAEKRVTRPAILQQLLHASSDTNAHVQFQVALTLSTVSPNRADVFQALHAMISNRIGNSWFQDAVLLSAAHNALQWYAAFEYFEGKTENEKKGKNEFLQKIAAIAGAKHQPNEIATLLQMLSESGDTGSVVSGMQGLAAGMQKHSGHISLSQQGQHALLLLVSTPNAEIGEAAFSLASHIQLKPTTELAQVVNQSVTIAADSSMPTARRVKAVQILGLVPQQMSTVLAKKLIQNHQPAEVQRAATKILLNRTDEPAVKLLIHQWGLLNPALHEMVEAGFLTKKERLYDLLEAVEHGTVKQEWISRNTQNRLLKYADSGISIRAGKLFTPIDENKRKNLIHDYNVATTVSGDAAQGKAVFLTACGSCHLLEKNGVDFGPDLHSVSHQTKINLLTMILDPNHDIAAGYEGYTIETTGGKTLAGIVVTENDEQLNLKTAGGAIQTILKNEIKSISPMAVSLMPEGLESSISKEQMTNLLEYIKTLQ